MKHPVFGAISATDERAAWYTARKETIMDNLFGGLSEWLKRATHLKPHQLVGLPGLTVHDAEVAAAAINALKDAAIDEQAAQHGAALVQESKTGV